jgi:hypothetical protein
MHSQEPHPPSLFRGEGARHGVWVCGVRELFHGGKVGYGKMGIGNCSRSFSSGEFYYYLQFHEFRRKINQRPIAFAFSSCFFSGTSSFPLCPPTIPNSLLKCHEGSHKVQLESAEMWGHGVNSWDSEVKVSLTLALKFIKGMTVAKLLFLARLHFSSL